MSDVNILVLAGLSGLATLVGVFLGSLFKKTKNNIIFSAGFAASLMILISVFELIPTAVKDISLVKVFFWVFIGSFVLWLANFMVPHLHSVSEIKNCDDKCLMKMSYLITLGLILHDFPEGFAISSSFDYSNSLGLLVVAVTFIHNVPEGYILTMAPLKFNDRSFYYRSALLSMLATFVGAVLGIKLISSFQNLNAVFLSLAAGAMLFISIHELLPESFKHKNFKILSLGITSAIVVYFALRLL